MQQIELIIWVMMLEVIAECRVPSGDIIVTAALASSDERQSMARQEN